MSVHQKTFLTAEEYLAVERKAEVKSEHCAGETFLMAGASERHNLIVANLVGEFSLPAQAAALQSLSERYESEDTGDGPIHMAETMASPAAA